MRVRCRKIPVGLSLACLFAIGVQCSENENASAGIRKCRIHKMYNDLNGSPHYTFRYNDDGSLRAMNSPDYNIEYKYEQGRIKTISLKIGLSEEILTYAYPSENLIQWSSSDETNLAFSLYRTSDKVDSLKVFQSETGNPLPYRTYSSTFTYTGNNVNGIITSEFNTYKEIAYDNGLNPATLFRQSTGIYSGAGILDYAFIVVGPEMLSENNPVSFVREYTLPGWPPQITNVEFEYVYSNEHSYPIEIRQYIDGALNETLHFIYEYCD